MTKKDKKTDPKLGEFLSAALDYESYSYLLKHAPDLVDAIEKELEAGQTPDAIRWFISAQVGPERQALALRAEQAARYMQGVQS